MSLGDLKTSGQGGKNTPWQTSVVQLLVAIKNSIIIANGAYTESNQTITGTTMTLAPVSYTHLTLPTILRV